MARNVIITTTHDRPLCFGILEGWVKAQTVQPDIWLVVNDSERPQDYSYNMGQFVIERQDIGDYWLGDDNAPSICKNWLQAIKYIEPDDNVLVFEDDDYYHPLYSATMLKLLEVYDMAGVSRNVYYKLPTRRFIRMLNDDHASLAATAFKGHLAPEVERICRLHKSVFIDIYLWVECGNIFNGNKVLKKQPLPDGRMLQVGMKNMPGAVGLGLGQKNPHDGSTDPLFSNLREWLGSDSKVYERM